MLFSVFTVVTSIQQDLISEAEAAAPTAGEDK